MKQEVGKVYQQEQRRREQVEKKEGLFGILVVSEAVLADAELFPVILAVIFC
jgi:hypothetical protein